LEVCDDSLSADVLECVKPSIIGLPSIRKASELAGFLCMPCNFKKQIANGEMKLVDCQCVIFGKTGCREKEEKYRNLKLNECDRGRLPFKAFNT
jgi:hypothetical protein